MNDSEERIRAARKDAIDKVLGEAMDIQEAANFMGISVKDTIDAITDRSVVAVPHEGIMRFPLWQFEGNCVVLGLPEVLKALRIGALARAFWLRRPCNALAGRTPIEVLREGGFREVIAEARGVGAQTGTNTGGD